MPLHYYHPEHPFAITAKGNDWLSSTLLFMLGTGIEVFQENGVIDIYPDKPGLCTLEPINLFYGENRDTMGIVSIKKNADDAVAKVHYVNPWNRAYSHSEEISGIVVVDWAVIHTIPKSTT